jgi:Ca2+-binding EF-hand superfamily protein
MVYNSSSAQYKKDARRAAAKFDHSEISILKQTFKDLAERSPGKTVDKATFLTYFPLPGLIGERLFATFDSKHTGNIDYEEFICGLAICCRGTLEQKIKLIFQMYDLAGDGSISRPELTTMLNQVPRNLLHIDEDEGVTSTELNFTNEDMVDKAFDECDLNHDGRLSEEQFTLWCERTPEVVEMLESVLPYSRTPVHNAGGGGAHFPSPLKRRQRQDSLDANGAPSEPKRFTERRSSAERQDSATPGKGGRGAAGAGGAAGGSAEGEGAVVDVQTPLMASDSRTLALLQQALAATERADVQDTIGTVIHRLEFCMAKDKMEGRRAQNVETSHAGELWKCAPRFGQWRWKKRHYQLHTDSMYLFKVSR